MAHGIRFLVSVLVVASLAGLHPARADHESAETILVQFQRYQARLHILMPTKAPRVLDPSRNQELVSRIAVPAKRFADETMSALVIENGELVFESYARGASRESRLNAYSMTKSLTALAVGEAFCAGKIKSLSDPASMYAPQLTGTAYGAASIRNLLSYTSGAQDPGGDGYAGIHDRADFRAMTEHKLSLADLMRKYGEARFEPGKKFIYNGLDSEALSLVVRGATGMPLPQWFESTVWQKVGAEFEAGWFLDRDGNGVAEVLFFASTRDFARVGLYVLERLTGSAKDPCLNEFIQDAAMPHVQKGYWDSAPRFGLGLHRGADGNTWIFGHGGQRIGINAKTGRVVATNGSRQWRGYDDQVQSLLSY